MKTRVDSLAPDPAILENNPEKTRLLAWSVRQALNTRSRKWGAEALLIGSLATPVMAGPFPPVVELSELEAANGGTGINGFVVVGDRDDYASFSVSGAGDFNGDGIDDFLVGAPNTAQTDTGLKGAGEAYLLFGHTHAFPAEVELASLHSTADCATDGVVVANPSARSIASKGPYSSVLIDRNLGKNLSGLGDINGDGIDDIGISSDILANHAGCFDPDQYELPPDCDPQNPSPDVCTPIPPPGCGTLKEAEYVIFGSSACYSPQFDVANLTPENGADGSTGIRLAGQTTIGQQAADPAFFRDAGAAGDINGDGIDDWIVPARSFEPNPANSLYNRARWYLIYGKADLPAQINPGVSPPDHVLINSVIARSDCVDFKGTAPYSCLINDFSAAGDVNGDGFDDLILGGSLDKPNDAANSFVLFGHNSLPAGIDLTDLTTAGGGDGSMGFELSDLPTPFSFAGAGDLNGDGYDDIAFGAPASGPGGQGYVVLGQQNFPATLDLENLGASGFEINSARAQDQTGSDVAAAGDINGDGFDDLMIGAPGYREISSSTPKKGGYTSTAYTGNNNGNPNGKVYVVQGTGNGFGQAINLADLESGAGQAGFAINGTTWGRQIEQRAFESPIGKYLRNPTPSRLDENQPFGKAGDVNGDGIGDLIISHGHDIAKSYVLFGIPLNVPPKAVIDVMQLSNIGNQVSIQLSGAGSSDIEDGAANLVYSWSLDGMTVCAGANPGDCINTEAQTSFGTHDIILTVTDSGGKIDTSTQTITLDPAALALFDCEKIETRFCVGDADSSSDDDSSADDDGSGVCLSDRVKVSGQVGLPIGVDYQGLQPQAAIQFTLAAGTPPGGGTLAVDPVFLSAHGSHGEHWKLSVPGASVEMLEFDWKGARFSYSDKNVPVKLESELITSESTVIEVEYDRRKIAAPFTIDFAGQAIVTVDPLSGMVNPMFLVTEKKAGKKFLVSLPFPLVDGDQIIFSGGVSQVVDVSEHYTNSLGRFKLEATMPGDPLPDGADSLPEFMRLNVGLGLQRYPGECGAGPAEIKVHSQKWKAKD